MHRLYVIECRNPDGSLDFEGAQPENFFSMKAIQGISENDMAKRIFAEYPDAVLRGETVSAWPLIVDSRWRARLKTW